MPGGERSRTGRGRVLGVLLAVLILVPITGAAASADAEQHGEREEPARDGLIWEGLGAGDCVTWDQELLELGQVTVEVVPCEDEHLVEITAIIDPLPAPILLSVMPRLREDVLRDLCRPLMDEAMGGVWDSHGRFAVHFTYPTFGSALDGQTNGWCGVSARYEEPFSGRASEQVQYQLRPVGSCWTVEDLEVDCLEAHAFEVVGYADLAGFDEVGEALSELGDHCDDPGPGVWDLVISDDSVGFFHFIIEDVSWAAGRRSTECLVANVNDEGEPIDADRWITQG